MFKTFNAVRCVLAFCDKLDNSSLQRQVGCIFGNMLLESVYDSGSAQITQNSNAPVSLEDCEQTPRSSEASEGQVALRLQWQ